MIKLGGTVITLVCKIHWSDTLSLTLHKISESGFLSMIEFISKIR